MKGLGELSEIIDKTVNDFLDTPIPSMDEFLATAKVLLNACHYMRVMRALPCLLSYPHTSLQPPRPFHECT